MGTGLQTSPDTRTLLCFSRAVTLPSSSNSSSTTSGRRRRLAQASSSPLDVSQVMVMNYASGPNDGFVMHTSTAGYTLNLATGEVRRCSVLCFGCPSRPPRLPSLWVAAWRSSSAHWAQQRPMPAVRSVAALLVQATLVTNDLKTLIFVHGVLMIVAFTFLMPFAMSLASNKCVHGHFASGAFGTAGPLTPHCLLAATVHRRGVMAKTLVAGKSIWYWLHIGCQVRQRDGWRHR